MSVRQTITEYIYPPGNCKKVAFEKKKYIYSAQEKNCNYNLYYIR